MKNNSNLAQIMRKLAPLLDDSHIEIMAGNTAWNIVLGVLPFESKGFEKQIMKENRKDTSAEKIDNIERITNYADYFVSEKPDFEYSYLESFSLALHQLLRYASGDQQAENSLKRLKDLYVSFMTLYFIESIKNGINKTAKCNIIYFSQKIFGESQEISTKLNNIIL